MHLFADVDYVVSSANKCIEGVPGFAFALARAEALAACEGRARSLSLDLHAQWRGLEDNGQFRFTPPTHALLAFHQALLELEAEGGVAGRAARYRRNRDVVVPGLRALGVATYLPETLQGYIITSFRYPEHPAFAFADFYERLSQRGFVIYPGKVSRTDCFRIGHIGRIGADESAALVAATGSVLAEMGVAP
jgi:2-aminoethylphosphonate-pyruvate transaminase